MNGYRKAPKILSFEGINVSEQSIPDMTYPLSDAYYVVMRKDSEENPSIKRIVEWLGSEKGKETLVSAGFIITALSE